MEISTFISTGNEENSLFSAFNISADSSFTSICAFDKPIYRKYGVSISFKTGPEIRPTSRTELYKSK